MKVTFILPAVGRKPNAPYVRTWQMEPLAIAALAAATPPDIEREFFDDRVEPIDYDTATNLVAISAETYTARRTYQIAACFRRRGIPVVMGGFHPTLAPDDAIAHADAIVVGEAEDIWPTVLRDAAAGRLQRRYRAAERPSLADRTPDRSIYRDKAYQPLALVETSRGCRFNCEFCSITRFYDRTCRERPVPDIVAEIASLETRYVFFTDDNIATGRAHFRELLEALLPLGISWAAQVSIDVAQDDALLRLMRRSGCVCVLIGFETLNATSLARMNKGVNARADGYDAAARALRKHGIGVYGTFVFGYDGDCAASFREVFDFAGRHGFFFAAFNPLVPFPGTGLYERLAAEDRLLYPKWWLSEDYRFGDIAFHVDGMTPGELAGLCYTYRQRFYGMPSTLRRMANWRANCRTPRRLLLYLSLNRLSAKDVAGRQELRLGTEEPTA